MRPEGEVEVHPEDARRYGLENGCMGRIVTKSGSIEVKVFVTEKTAEGAIFYPFHFAEAPANMLIAGTLDKASQTPAYKRTAARVERVDAVQAAAK
jgi:predicted molibdopterin-dependent oxidoreductase YjgC